MPTSNGFGKDDPVAIRLRELREALGYTTARAFAAYLEMSSQRWGNFETGSPLSREVAFLLVQKVPGLTLDWLYFGKADGLPVALAKRLGAIGEPRKATTRG